MNKMFFLFVVTAFILSCQQKKQYREVLTTLDAEHQACLDKGAGMMDCSYRYSVQMDSMLNLVYKELMSTYSDDRKQKLREEERNWIQKRDRAFKEMYTEISRSISSGESLSQDDRMMVYDQEALFIRERVSALITALEKE